MLVVVLCILLATNAWAAKDCTVDGKHIKDGDSYQPSSCETCVCNDGQITCMMAQCAPIDCVNPTKEAGQCCFTCPGGPNCYMGNKIIPAGVPCYPNALTVCKCPVPTGSHSHATCSTSMHPHDPNC